MARIGRILRIRPIGALGAAALAVSCAGGSGTGALECRDQNGGTKCQSRSAWAQPDRQGAERKQVERQRRSKGLRPLDAPISVAIQSTRIDRDLKESIREPKKLERALAKAILADPQLRKARSPERADVVVKPVLRHETATLGRRESTRSTVVLLVYAADLRSTHGPQRVVVEAKRSIWKNMELPDALAAEIVTALRREIAPHLPRDAGSRKSKARSRSRDRSRPASLAP